MTKRLTKAQREKRDFDALYVRVLDIYTGACGEDRTKDGWCLSGEEYERVVLACKSAFRGGEGDDSDGFQFGYLFREWNIAPFCDTMLAAQFMFDHGVRA